MVTVLVEFRNRTLTEREVSAILSSERSRTVDICLAIIYLVCFLLGTFFNTTALLFFGKQSALSSNKRYFKSLYTVIVTVDLLVCVTVLPLVWVYLSRDRAGGLFLLPWVCYLWAVVWELLPSVAVFLVAVLSFSRMVVLVAPLKVLHLTRPLSLLVSYLGVMFLRTTIPLIFKVSFVAYQSDISYCFFWQGNLDVSWVYQTLPLFQLTLPILPISISVTISIFKLYQARGRSRRAHVTYKPQSRASVTVVRVTLVYIVLNIPVFLNYVYYTIWSVQDYFTVKWTGRHISYLQYYNTSLLFNYSWGLTYVMCVAVNSTINPVVYWCNVSAFRCFIKCTFVGFGAKINDQITLSLRTL